jgi:hypothetical protein
VAGPGRPGRERAIQGEVQQRLLEALSKGAPIRIACRYAGVAESVYFEEVQRNPEFAERASRERTKRAVHSLEAIWKAGDEDWRAHAKYLELSHPDDFGRRLEVSGPGGGPVRIAPEVKPEFVAEVTRLLEGADTPADAGGEEPVHPV